MFELKMLYQLQKVNVTRAIYVIIQHVIRYIFLTFKPTRLLYNFQLLYCVIRLYYKNYNYCTCYVLLTPFYRSYY